MVNQKKSSTMTPKSLQQPLEDLHGELTEATTAEPQHLQLQGLQESTRQLLDQLGQGTPPAALSPFREELKGAVARFEATHPQLTLALINVITALNRIGI